MEIKNSLQEIAGICRKDKIELLAIHPLHLGQIGHLPQIHGDPFDRLIISQALVENLTVKTKYSFIPKYDVKALW